MTTHPDRPHGPGSTDHQRAWHADAGLPGWTLVLRRTAIFCGIGAVLIIAFSLLNDWMSGFEVARALAAGGGAVAAAGAGMAIAVTSSGMHQSTAYPMPPTWDMQGDAEPSSRRNRFIYRITVPVLLAGLLLAAIGLSGMLLL